MMGVVIPCRCKCSCVVGVVHRLIVVGCLVLRFGLVLLYVSLPAYGVIGAGVGGNLVDRSDGGSVVGGGVVFGYPWYILYLEGGKGVLCVSCAMCVSFGGRCV